MSGLQYHTYLGMIGQKPAPIEVKQVQDPNGHLFDMAKYVLTGIVSGLVVWHLTRSKR